MPTFAHGISSKIYLSGYNVTNYFKSYAANGAAGSADISTLGDTYQSFVSGLKGATINLSGFFSFDTGGSTLLLEAAFANATNKILTIYPQGDTLGNYGLAVKGFAASLDVQADTGSAGMVNGSIQSNTGFYLGRSLHALGAETSTGNGTSVDNGAATSNGGDAYLQVTAFSGTDADIVVADSADNASFATIATFTQVTAANVAERVAVSGAVRRYLRYTLSGTFTTITFNVLFARK